MTAQLGDPSGKDTTRPILDSDEVLRNADSILNICKGVLLDGFNVVPNHIFFNDIGLPGFLTNIASKFTVARLLSRDGFRKRIEDGNPIGLHELILPLLQGWDSVMVKADVEIGGTDQLFNFQISRELQESCGQKPEVCIMTPVINGTDGRKMSKSFDNCIWVDENPNDIFGKVMSVSDETCEEWIKIFCQKDIGEQHPMKRKILLASNIVSIIHNDTIADSCVLFFKNTIQQKVVPDEIISIAHTDTLSFISLMRNCSGSEAKRLIKNGGVSINGRKISENSEVLSVGDIIKIGKRNFAKVI